MIADPAKLATKENAEKALCGVKELLKAKEDGDNINAPDEINACRKAIDELLQRAGVDQLVVLRDDLDSCLPDTAINTLEAVRMFVFTARIAFVVAAGPTRVEQELRLKDIAVSSGGVRSVGKRHNLLTKHERLLRLEKAMTKRKIELKKDQIRLPEHFSLEIHERHIEAPHTRALVAVDTFLVGALKGVGKVYLQTAIDCYSRYTWARLYPSKQPLAAVHTMNQDVILTFEKQGAKIEVVLSDSGRQFCGKPDQHPHEPFLQLEDIEHRLPRARRP